MAGASFWLANYPFDFLKTKLQTRGEGDRSVIAMAKRIYKQGGVRAFYSVLAFCVLDRCAHSRALARVFFAQYLLMQPSTAPMIGS